MSYFVEYPLSDGSTIWVEAEDRPGVVRVANNQGQPVTSKINFNEAFANVRSSIQDVLHEFDALQIQEAEIKFGLKSIGEAGVFAIGKIGAEINYEVTLKWKKPDK